MALNKQPRARSKRRRQDLGQASVVVVVVNYRTPHLTERCLAALREERRLLPTLRVVVVDGGSADGSAERLSKVVASHDHADWVSFLPLEVNGGYGWANNQAMLTLARDNDPPDFIHILNPDAEVREGALAALVSSLLAHPHCAAAGSQLFGPDGKAVASAFRFPSPGQDFAAAAQSERLRHLLGISPTVLHPAENEEVDWVSGASVMFRVDALRQTGLFDDGFFLYFEEVELMHRMRNKGWMIRHVRSSQVEHVEGASTGIAGLARPLPDYWYQSRRRYYALTGTRGTVVAAGLAFLGGFAVASVMKLVGRQRKETGFRAASLFRLGFWPTPNDAVASPPAWGDAPGKLPAWMAGK